MQLLSEDVVGTLPLNQRFNLVGETLLLVGSYEDFSVWFFKWWQLEKNTGRIRLF